MTTPLGELRIVAVLENLRILSAFIQGIGQRLQLTEKCLFDIELAVEEAATNVVYHAYGDIPAGDLLAQVDLLDQDSLRIRLTDWGAALDPESVPAFDINAPLEARIDGGMGLHFINSLMDRVTRENGSQLSEPNTLTMVKRIDLLQNGARQPDTLRELNAMLAVSQLMSAGVPLEQLLHTLINKLVESLDTEGGTLYLIDREKEELYSYVLREGGERPRLEEIRLKMGDGIAGHVALTGQILNIKDAATDTRFNPTYDQLTGYKSVTLLAAPMFDRDLKIIGVVELINKKGKPFSKRDERVLMAMAAQAAINIENARLYNSEMERRLMNQELETARRIQTSFLPQNIPQPPGWEVAAFWRPMNDVAGDFYDFFLLPDGRLAVVIADVSGKGIPAALFMALSVTVLRFAMGLNFPPDKLMNHSNQTIADSQQSMMFTTAFAAYINLETGEISFASAGHNPPLLYRAAVQQCHYLTAPGVAMGIFRGAAYEAKVVPLEPGDVLVMYTDGITEIINDDEEEFGVERLEALVVERAGSASAQELVNAIEQAAMAFTQGRGAFDDETLVVVRRVK